MDLKIGKRLSDSTKKRLLIVCVAVLISLLAELFVFNIRAFQSMGYEPKPVGAGDIVAIENGHLLENGDIELNDDAGELVIALRSVDVPVNDLYLDVVLADEPVSADYEDNVCDVNIFAEDGYSITQKKIVKGVPASRFFWLDTVNDLEVMRIEISSASEKGIYSG